MKFSTKLFLCVSIILAITLACFCTSVVLRNFHVTMQQAYKEASLELRTIRMSLQLSLHSSGEKATLEALSNQLWQVSYGKKLRFYNGQGELLYSNSADLDLRRHERQFTDQNKESVSFHLGDETGFYEITAQSPFQVGSDSYYLILVLSADPIVEQIRHQAAMFREMYIIIMCILLPFIFGFAYLFTKPIKRVTISAQKLASGQLNERVEIHSADEIGQMSQSFNQMAQSIQEMVESLNRETVNKDTFIANFAHEIKTPMTSILGYADLICRTPGISGEIKEASEFILGESMRLEALSHKLMELYVVDKQDFILTEIELSEFIASLVYTLDGMLRVHTVTLSQSIEPAYVSIEEDLFSSLIANLIDNAIKAGATRLLLYGRSEGQTYMLRLQDNGCGMDQKDVEHITEAFYMVDKARSRSQHGAGLGLALCAKIASLHKISLEFSSEKGVGTTVTLKMKGTKVNEETME